MNSNEIAVDVAEVLAKAERILGPAVSPVLLEQRAREAVEVLWLARPKLTDYLATLAVRRLRERICGTAGDRRRGSRPPAGDRRYGLNDQGLPIGRSGRRGRTASNADHDCGAMSPAPRGA